MPSYPLLLVLTVAIETPVVALCYPGQRLRLALTCIAATTVTHAFMHFGLPRLVSSYAAFLLVGELVALVGEALAYALVARPRDLARALVAAAAANALSFGVGLLLFG